MKKILFRIVFKKIPKTQYGRCVECHANHICGVTAHCTCTMEQQYALRYPKVSVILKELLNNKLI